MNNEIHEILMNLNRGRIAVDQAEEQIKSAMYEAIENAVLGEGWRDARKEAPNKTGVYPTYTYPTEYDGEIYSFELYSEKHGGWCEAEHTIDLWCNLPDLPL